MSKTKTAKKTAVPKATKSAKERREEAMHYDNAGARFRIASTSRLIWLVD